MSTSQQTDGSNAPAPADAADGPVPVSPEARLAEECEAVNFAWQALCDKVAEKAQQGVLVQFSDDDRVVGLTIGEARSIRNALQALSSASS